MPAFIDASCGKCGKRIGWFGEVADHPPCPRCGNKPDPAVMAADETKFAEMRRLMLADVADAPPNDLQRMRVLAGLSLRQAAKQLGVEPKVLCDCENGRCHVGDDLARKMASVYQCGEVPDARGEG